MDLKTGQGPKNMKKNKALSAAKPCVPDGMLIYAVGDIHGQLHLLDALLEQITADAGQLDYLALIIMGLPVSPT